MLIRLVSNPLTILSMGKRTRYKEYARDPTIPVPSRTALRQGLESSSLTQSAAGICTYLNLRQQVQYRID